MTSIINLISSNIGFLSATGLHLAILKKSHRDMDKPLKIADIILAVVISIGFGVFLGHAVIAYYHFNGKEPVEAVVIFSRMIGATVGYAGIIWLGRKINDFATESIKAIGKKNRNSYYEDGEE